MITGKPFELEIVTPRRVEYTGKVDSVNVPGALRPFQVLINHAPIISELEIGEINIDDAKGVNIRYACGGGFVQVLSNKMSIVVESAEEADTIDVERAKEAEQRARERMAKRDQYDFKRAQLALTRAINRLRVSGGRQSS